MRFSAKTAILGGAVLLTTGCATPLNSVQKQELATWHAKGLEVREKDPEVAMVMGILPGGGSFYTRNYGIGIANLLMWPISVVWDPVSGYDGAQVVNYNSTKAAVGRKMSGEIRDLDYELESGKIDRDRYLKMKREIERKYAPER